MTVKHPYGSKHCTGTVCLKCRAETLFRQYVMDVIEDNKDIAKHLTGNSMTGERIFKNKKHSLFACYHCLESFIPDFDSYQSCLMTNYLDHMCQEFRGNSNVCMILNKTEDLADKLTDIMDKYECIKEELKDLQRKLGTAEGKLSSAEIECQSLKTMVYMHVEVLNSVFNALNKYTHKPTGQDGQQENRDVSGIRG